MLYSSSFHPESLLRACGTLEYSRHDKSGIHLIPKWRPINCSFVCMLISPLCLVIMYKKQKNFEVKMRQRGLINVQTKE